jgi:hypothetical protein
MTYLNGDVLVPIGKHRLHPYLSNLLIVTAGIGKALNLTANVYPHGDFSWFNSRQFPVTVVLPMSGTIEAALQQQRIDVFPVSFVPVRTQGAFGLGLDSKVSNSIFVDTIVPVFTTFFEDNVEWLQENVNRDKTKWPGVMGFARVVRNAIAHGGSININDPAATPATWHHLSYGHAQNGQRIIGTELIFGDIMILMFELSDELDRRGCPI